MLAISPNLHINTYWKWRRSNSKWLPHGFFCFSFFTVNAIIHQGLLKISTNLRIWSAYYIRLQNLLKMEVIRFITATSRFFSLFVYIFTVNAITHQGLLEISPNRHIWSAFIRLQHLLKMELIRFKMAASQHFPLFVIHR